jgi:hypothetical protein
MKQNKRNRIKKTNLVFKRETIKTLATHELDQVAGGFDTVTCETCSSSVLICQPN